jgi:hypothetical protein
MQTVQYGKQRGQIIEVEVEVRIWVQGPYCVIADTSATVNHYYIAKAASEPYDKCGTFNIVGMEEGTWDALIRAIERASRM